MHYTATYSPEDNKLRLYATSRLDAETYARVKSAGFKWAPKQELFVAPMWTPEREDLLIELAGEIEDEDKSLVDRAEERSERFEDYSDKRAADARQAHAAVSAIADHIPLGQPILVGHHSERHARKDKERIENGMRRAVKAWKTSQYWLDRAAGAIHAAKYKERPDVRARRIKGLESDERKQLKAIEEAERWLMLWSKPGLTLAEARALANVSHGGPAMCKNEQFDGPYTQYWSAYDVLQDDERRYKACPSWTVEQVQEVAARVYPARIRGHQRWLEHFQNRLAYERAMLAESGGLPADRFDFQVGGQVLYGGQWCPILRVNKSAGRITSVSVPSGYSWTSKAPIERIRDYRPPTEKLAEQCKAATKKPTAPPLVNPTDADAERLQALWNAEFEAKLEAGWKREQFKPSAVLRMTQAEYSARSKGSYAHFETRTLHACGKPARRSSNMYTPEGSKYDKALGAVVCKLRMASAGGWYSPAHLVILTDKAQKPIPWELAETPAEPQARPELPPVETDIAFLERQAERAEARRLAEPDPEAQQFEALEDSLKAGVQTVVAPQLFVTPKEISERMVSYADIDHGQRILEPSAGTGALLDAIQCDEAQSLSVNAVEINVGLAGSLSHRYPAVMVRAGDFLECNGNLGQFDRVIMNPPFVNGADIKHIEHARGFLKPGGRLVALCANGPRQRDKLMSIATHWEDLPAGSFAEAGTNVNVALVVIDN